MPEPAHTSPRQPVPIELNGTPALVSTGTTVAAAIVQLAEHRPSLRRSVTGAPRGPLCGMGVCFECRATVNSVAHRRSCLIECQPGMRIQTDAR